LDDARAHLAKAQEFLAAAEFTLDLDLFNAATSSAVSSGINPKDAIYLRLTGVSRKTDNHAQAVAELAQADDAGAALTQTFSRLLRMKPAAQYQASSVTPADAGRPCNGRCGCSRWPPT
jgi:hypothetical protein